MENKYQAIAVGSAIKNVISDENYYYKGKINLSSLDDCFTKKVTKEGIEKEYYNLSLKVIKSPKNEVTHLITDSLYYSKGITDQFAEVNINIPKEKLKNIPTDGEGNILITVSLYDKEKEREFQSGDFKVYLTKPAGVKVEKDDYLGTGIILKKQKDKQNSQKIEREFCGSGYIDHNDKLAHNTALNISIKSEQFNAVSKGKAYAYVNLIGFKNEPEKLAAYISNTKDDKAALYTFKIDTNEFSKLPVNEKGYAKIAGYFDDKLENKNYNIKLLQYMTVEQRKIGQPIEVGMGADRDHMKWQNKNAQKDKGEKKIQSNKIPEAKEINDNQKAAGKSKSKGIE